MRRPTVKLPAPLVPTALLLALALLGSACAQSVGSPQTAAVINGEQVDVATIRPLIANARQVQVLQGGAPLSERDAAVGVLSDVALITLAEQELVALGGDPISEGDLEEALEEQVAAAGGQEAFDAQLEAQGTDARIARFNLRFTLVLDRLSEVLAAEQGVEIEDAEIQAVYDAQFPPDVSHILVATEAEAADVLARLDAGEDFADLAAEVSIDPGSGPQGGALGPLERGAFVPEFEIAALELEPGTVSDPVETQFGFHLITTTVTTPLDEEARELISGQLADQQVQQRLNEVVLAALQDADAEVNPRFGTWAPEVTPEGQLISVIVGSDPLGDLVPATAEDPALEGLGLPVPGAAGDPAAPPVQQ